LESDASDFLRGTPPTFESSRRGQVEEDVYGIWVDRGRGIVVSSLGLPLSNLVADVKDLHYWTYVYTAAICG
jgi:hypothetical protein